MGILLSVSGGLSAGCGAGSAAKAARTDAPTTADAFGAPACLNASQDAEPWVVDLPPDRRVDVEAAMRKGVVVVSYDCKNLKILQGCKAAGAYDYTGTTALEDSLVLEDADTAALNLSGGAALAAKVKADFDRGMKISIGYVLVGQRSTPVDHVGRAELQGRCDGATHFIARASIGAYAVASDSSAKMGTVAEIFERGGSATSSSSAIRSTKVGERDACAAASVDDTGPPAKCAAPVKVLLMGIEKNAEPAPTDAPPVDEAPPPCPSGSVRRGAACVPSKAAGPRACSVGDSADCSKQCSAGDASSCAILGFMYEKGKGIAVDNAKAFEHYDRACKQGDPNGCTGVAFLHSKGQGVAADRALAQKMFRDACNKGNARACSGLGHDARIDGKNDEAVKFLERSCKLGYERACYYAGTVLLSQNKEEARAQQNLERACLGHDYRGCLALAGMLFSGMGGEADPARANKEQSRALNALNKECGAGDSEACTAIGDFYNGRYGKKVRNPQKALESYEKACKAGQASACTEAEAIKRE